MSGATFEMNFTAKQRAFVQRKLAEAAPLPKGCAVVAVVLPGGLLAKVAAPGEADDLVESVTGIPRAA